MFQAHVELLMNNHLSMAEKHLYFGNPKSKKQQPQMRQHGFDRGPPERSENLWTSSARYRIPDRMPECMSEKMPDTMAECISHRMPGNMPE